jgi:hypothetical protein
MSLDEVWRTIREAGQRRHWAYDKGMSRLSCSFCIMSSKPDLIIAARERPDLLAEYVALEKEIGHTVFSRKGTKAEGRQGETLPIPIREHIGLDPRRMLPMARGEPPRATKPPKPPKPPKLQPTSPAWPSPSRPRPLPVPSREEFLQKTREPPRVKAPKAEVDILGSLDEDVARAVRDAMRRR